MKKIFKKYLFVFEFLAVALLIVAGIFLLVNTKIFLIITGTVLLVFGLFRVIPLIKTTKDNLMKVINILEILVNLAAGVFLIMEGTKETPNEDLLRYFIGAALYLRGFLYFFGTTIRKESTDYTKFFAHVVIFTIGTGILFSKDLLNAKAMAWLIAGISFLVAAVLGFSGFGHYKRYRYEQLAKDETSKAIEKQKEAPAVKEDPVEAPAVEKEPYVEPVEDKHEIRIEA